MAKAKQQPAPEPEHDVDWWKHQWENLKKELDTLNPELDRVRLAHRTLSEQHEQLQHRLRQADATAASLREELAKAR